EAVDVLEVGVQTQAVVLCEIADVAGELEARTLAVAAAHARAPRAAAGLEATRRDDAERRRTRVIDPEARPQRSGRVERAAQAPRHADLQNAAHHVRAVQRRGEPP